MLAHAQPQATILTVTTTATIAIAVIIATTTAVTTLVAKNAVGGSFGKIRIVATSAMIAAISMNKNTLTETVYV